MNILVSYWSHKNRDLNEYDLDVRLFADSGAYSAYTVGAEIDIRQYAKWVEKWIDRFDVYSNLDVIGDPDATLENQRKLESFGLRPMPVFHTLEPFSYLETYAEEYDYIALGGMARYGRHASKLIPWIVKCFRLGAGAEFHGFGVTNWDVMRSFPWRSLDSTTWINVQRFGRIILFADHRLFQFQVNPAKTKKGESKGAKARLTKYQRDIHKMGFTVDDVLRACTPGDASVRDLQKEIAFAAFETAQRELSKRHPVTIYLAGG